MKTLIKLMTLLLAIVMLLQSAASTVLAISPVEAELSVYQTSTQPSSYSKDYNSGERDVVATTLSGTSADSYYTGSYAYDSLSEQSAATIKSSLTTLMKSTHEYISSYDDCHYKANRTDCENETGSSNKLSLIYTSYTATMSQWNGWNREHVWPKSLGGNNTSGGGADLHHIRPSDASVNSSRGNKKYGNATGGTAKYGNNPASGVLGGYYNSTYFEPLDNVKGDVARICLYVYVRWGSSWGADSITEVFQSVDVLLEWMELDPVDTWELGRNEVVQDIQGNRNVFIDYPEYAWLIFGEEIPDDMVTPSGEANGGHSWDDGEITLEPSCTSTGVITYTCTDSGCEETKTVTIDALGHSYGSYTVTEEATCTASGAKTAVCSRCSTQKTETIKATGHSFGVWITDVEATETTTGSKHRICATCSFEETATIPVIGHVHSYSSTVTQPSCEEKGYTTHSCQCGDYYTDTYVVPTGHSYSNGFCTSCNAPDPSAPVYTADDFANSITKLSLGILTGEQEYTEICRAINIYNNLSDDDKETVSTQYGLLKNIVSDYNSTVKSVNGDADQMSGLLLGDGYVLSTLLIYAAYSLLSKKYI